MGTSVAEGANASSIHFFHSTKTWVDTRALDQANAVADWPGVQAVATFPDLHPGRYGPVGAAILADRIYSHLIGGDIGCGMSVFRLRLPRRKLKLDKAQKAIRCLGEPYDAAADLSDGYQGEVEGLGTIGGGNHFCELQEVESADADLDLPRSTLMLMVHSGSRGQGQSVLNRFAAQAADGLDPASEAAAQYLSAHDAAVRFARQNRALIALRAARALGTAADLLCDAPHNLLRLERGMWMHRKGAAATDTVLVPLAGSRDSHSFLMRPSCRPPATSLSSTAHGAGRKFDRSAMHGRIRAGRADIAALTRNSFGGRIVCEDKDMLIEEAAQAYKPVERVAQDLEEAGIASRCAVLKPLLTFKKVRDHE